MPAGAVLLLHDVADGAARGVGRLRAEGDLPLTLGTCGTALLAATAVDGSRAAALQIAFIPLTYDVLGVVLMYGPPSLGHLPVKAAKWLGETAADGKLAALACILGVFLVVPGAWPGITGLLRRRTP